MSRIGIFDSGFGGLSVLQEAREHMVEGDFIYYADREHVPYGEKTCDQVFKYVSAVVEFLIGQNVDAVVIACNTATSVAIERLREKYSLPIVGMEPAVKKALDLYGDQRVIATATPITVRGDKMKMLVDRVDKHHLVDLIALPGLVHFAESEQFDLNVVTPYLREALGEKDYSQYSSLVLGCTHFGYFKDSFREILPQHVHFVDGKEGTIAQLQRKLDKLGNQVHKGSGSVVYYDSGVRCEGEALDKINRYLKRLEWLKKFD